MRQLVRQETKAGGAVEAVHRLAQDDVVSNRVGARIEAPRRSRGCIIPVDSDTAEIVLEAGLEQSPDRSVERHARRPQSGTRYLGR